MAQPLVGNADLLKSKGCCPSQPQEAIPPPQDQTAFTNTAMFAGSKQAVLIMDAMCVN